MGGPPRGPTWPWTSACRRTRCGARWKPCLLNPRGALPPPERPPPAATAPARSSAAGCGKTKFAELAEQALQRPVGGDRTAIGILARSALAFVELLRGEDLVGVGVYQLRPQRQLHPARLRREILLQADQFGIQSQVGGDWIGRLHHGAETSGLRQSLNQQRRQHARGRVHPAVFRVVIEFVRLAHISHLRRGETGAGARRIDYEHQGTLWP